MEKPAVQPCLELSVSRKAPPLRSIVYWKVGAFILVSTSPGFGETLALIGTLCGLVLLLISTPRVSRQAASLIAVFLLLILPITMYDTLQSMSLGFTTYSFIAIPIFVFSGFLLSQAGDNVSFIDLYERCILYLSSLSFVLFIIFIVYPEVAYLAPEYAYRETTHRTFIFLNILMNPDPVLRNAGFASEPGFYQILINIALYARLRRVGRPDRICIFYLLVVLSTLSTTGIAIAGLIVSTAFSMRYRMIILIIILAFFGLVETFVMTQYETKIANEAVFGPRIQPSINAFSMFLQYPLGIGAYGYSELVDRYAIGSWDSYTQVALRYGVLGLLALTIFLVSVARRHFLLVWILMISFLTSPIWFLPAVAAFYFPSGARSIGGRNG